MHELFFFLGGFNKDIGMNHFLREKEVRLDWKGLSKLNIPFWHNDWTVGDISALLAQMSFSEHLLSVPLSVKFSYFWLLSTRTTYPNLYKVSLWEGNSKLLKERAKPFLKRGYLLNSVNIVCVLRNPLLKNQCKRYAIKFWICSEDSKLFKPWPSDYY